MCVYDAKCCVCFIQREDKNTHMLIHKCTCKYSILTIQNVDSFLLKSIDFSDC